jgi:hypothetical protein
MFGANSGATRTLKRFRDRLVTDLPSDQTGWYVDIYSLLMETFSSAASGLEEAFG